MSLEATSTRSADALVPPSAVFTLELSKLLKGAAPVIANANCEFSYNWDFATNTGLAKLVSIDNCVLDITLNPLGIAGYLDFMSSLDQPLHTVINGQRVVLNRIILNVSLATNERKAGIMFNEDGSVIEVTANWGNGSSTENILG